MRRRRPPPVQIILSTGARRCSPLGQLAGANRGRSLIVGAGYLATGESVLRSLCNAVFIRLLTVPRGNSKYAGSLAVREALEHDQLQHLPQLRGHCLHG